MLLYQGAFVRHERNIIIFFKLKISHEATAPTCYARNIFEVKSLNILQTPNKLGKLTNKPQTQEHKQLTICHQSPAGCAMVDTATRKCCVKIKSNGWERMKETWRMAENGDKDSIHIYLSSRCP